MACDEVLDAQWLRENFLYGVNLTDDSGQAFPDSMFDLCIAFAKDLLGAEIGVSLDGVQTFDERYDVSYGDWGRNHQLQLNNGPVRSITSMQFKYGDISSVSIPASWIYLRDPELAITEIIAGTGTPSVSAMGNWAVLQRNFDARVPAYLRVVYTAGFDGDVYPYPAMIKMAIGHLAAMLPADTAGDLIGGAGIASYSLSMDGISQSINTTSSPMFHGYSALLKSWQEQIKRYMPILRNRYRGLPFHAV